MKTPEQVVQKQLEFYNAHDLEGFLSVFHNDAKVYNLSGGCELIMDGIEMLREKYGERLSTPNLHSEIEKRIVYGNTVIDHEIITMDGLEGTQRIAAIYEVIDGLIKTAWFVRE